MRVTRMVIRDFGSFHGVHEIKLDREPGVYYVSGKNKIESEVGANGAGKTTLWDAMVWCLTGKTIRDSRPGDSVEPWHIAKPSTAVSLEWGLNDYMHELRRGRSPNSLKMSSIRPGKSPIIDSREVTQEQVDKLWGMSEEVTRRTIILGQFGTFFLDLGPEEQSRLFNGTLALDVWLKAAKLAGVKEDKAAEAVRTSLRLRENVLVGLEDKRRRLDRALEERNRWNRDVDLKVNNLRDALRDRRAALDRLSADPPAKPTKAALDSPARREVRKAQAALETVTGLLSGLGGDLRVQRERDAAAIAEVERYRGVLRMAVRVCPECGQRVKEDHLAGKLELAEGRRGDARVAAREIGRKIADLEKDVNVARLAYAKADDAVLEEQRVDQRKQRDYFDWEQSCRHHEHEIESDEREVLSLTSRGNPHGELSKSLQREIEHDELFAKQLAADVVMHEKTAELAKYWSIAFKEIRLGIIDSVLAELELAASRNAEGLGLLDWAIRFDTERETKAGKISHGFTTLLYPPRVERPIRWERYSGGESQRWQLAVAFGLAEVLLGRAGINPNIEIIDEPTKGLSSQGVDDLLEYLRDRARELKRAIYLVDHHSLDRGAFDGVLVVEKTRDGSHIVEV